MPEPTDEEPPAAVDNHPDALLQHEPLKRSRCTDIIERLTRRVKKLDVLSFAKWLLVSDAAMVWRKPKLTDATACMKVYKADARLRRFQSEFLEDLSVVFCVFDKFSASTKNCPNVFARGRKEKGYKIDARVCCRECNGFSSDAQP